MIRKLLFGAVVALLLLFLAVTGVTIWWAKTVVNTADSELWGERENVKALKAYAEDKDIAPQRRTGEAGGRTESTRTAGADPGTRVTTLLPRAVPPKRPFPACPARVDYAL